MAAISDEDLYSVFIGLGKFYQGQGLYSLAESWYEKYVEVIKSRCGKNDSRYATSLAWLAFLYRSQGRYSEAEPLYQQALEMFEKWLGVDHPNTITVRNNLERLWEKLDGK